MSDFALILATAISGIIKQKTRKGNKYVYDGTRKKLLISDELYNCNTEQDLSCQFLKPVNKRDVNGAWVGC